MKLNEQNLQKLETFPYLGMLQWLLKDIWPKIVEFRVNLKGLKTLQMTV